MIDTLQTLPRIGEATARAAVADWTNDWGVYPCTDSTLRTYATQAAPAHDWPTDGQEFCQTWLALTDAQLSSLTLLTLAWGLHHAEIQKSTHD